MRVDNPKVKGAVKRHYFEWSDCTRCILSQTRINTVLIRGKKGPVDILFVGEAPGQSEDVTGQPFTGDAGVVLNMVLDKLEEEIKFTYSVINILACRPPKNRVPNEDEIIQCRPRVLDALSFLTPKLVVLLGDTARTHFPSPEEVTSYTPHKMVSGSRSKHYKPKIKEAKPDYPFGVCSIIHPASVLRLSETARLVPVIKMKNAILRHWRLTHGS